MLLSETGDDVIGCFSFPAVRRIEALLNPGDLKIITTAARAAGLDDAWAISSSQGSAIAYRLSVIRPQGEVVHRAGLESAGTPNSSVPFGAPGVRFIAPPLT